MASIRIKLPDGAERDFPAGATGRQIAEAISPRLAREAIAAKVNGKARDLLCPIDGDAEIRILTWDDREGKEIFWHSSSHIMAQAVREVFPNVKLAIGPPIEEGFYYDFDIERPFSPEDLAKIEAKMAEIVREDAPFAREVLDR